MPNLRDIHLLSEFQRNTREFLLNMKKSLNPIAFTVNGRAEVVVQNAQSYQETLNRLERAEAVAVIRRGMNDFETGNAQDAEEAFAEIRQKHGIPQ